MAFGQRGTRCGNTTACTEPPVQGVYTAERRVARRNTLDQPTVRDHLRERCTPSELLLARALLAMTQSPRVGVRIGVRLRRETVRGVVRGQNLRGGTDRGGSSHGVGSVLRSDRKTTESMARLMTTWQARKECGVWHVEGADGGVSSSDTCSSLASSLAATMDDTMGDTMSDRNDTCSSPADRAAQRDSWLATSRSGGEHKYFAPSNSSSAPASPSPPKNRTRPWYARHRRPRAPGGRRRSSEPPPPPPVGEVPLCGRGSRRARVRVRYCGHVSPKMGTPRARARAISATDSWPG